MSSPRLIVLAASAGGFEAVGEILSLLPADFPAAIALIQHRGAEFPDRLIELLARRTPLAIRHAIDGAPLEAATVYVCPPGVHMVAERAVRLLTGPKLNFVRPNADLMIDSVARVYGGQATCVILSGSGRDGAIGSLTLARAGGTVIAQAIETCGFDGMPTAALEVGATSLQLAPRQIAAALRDLIEAPPPPASSATTALPPLTKVLLADDHQILLEGLHLLIDSEDDMQVVGRAEDGSTALRRAFELSPDVVVMDVCMPGMDGVEATRQIVARAPAAKIVALSSHCDATTVSQVIQAGATAYLTKQRAFGELVNAIRSVKRREPYFSCDVAHLVASGRVRAPLM